MDTLCVWSRNDLQSAEPQQGTSTSDFMNTRAPSLLAQGSTPALWWHRRSAVRASRHRHVLLWQILPYHSFMPRHFPATGEVAGVLQALPLLLVLPRYLPFLQWLFHLLPLTIASGRTLSFLGLDTASA